MNKIYSYIVILLLLSSCSFTKDLDVFSKPQDKTPLALETPPPLNLNDYKVIMITPDNAEVVFAELKRRKVNTALFALTDEDYEAASENEEAIEGRIIVLRRIIEEYQKYYEKPKEVNKIK